ncbi:hypothetical protein [Massilia glaciei]|nr:hypothetical protein [Massilia glaciei]
MKNAAEEAKRERQHQPVRQPKKAAACAGSGHLMLWDRTQEVPAGGQIQATVLRAHRPGFVESVPDECVDGWEIETTPYASIGKTGLIEFQAGTPDGTLITVAAVVGKERIRGKVRAFDARQHPLKGTWRQVAERPCEAGAVERMPYEPIQELVFDAGGRFSVTQRPFEAYKDYWGEYRHVASSGAVEFSIEKGNKVPPDVRLQGTAKITGADLVLDDVVLWPAPDGVKLCGLRFAR